jgi:hypothetical protein
MHTRRSFLNPCLAGLLVFAAAPAAQALASPAPTVTTGGLYRVLIKVSDGAYVSAYSTPVLVR